MSTEIEVFVSVDIETAGPIPGEYSMLSIGACTIFAPDHTFSCNLRPITTNFDPVALKVTGLSLENLRQAGSEPKDAMNQFANWLSTVCPPASKPIFVGFNAPFDWSFVNYYFHKFVGTNPFGFTALDIKALYMGATGCRWGDTRSSNISERLKPDLSGTHDALRDALYQAEMYRLIWSEVIQRR